MHAAKARLCGEETAAESVMALLAKIEEMVKRHGTKEKGKGR